MDEDLKMALLEGNPNPSQLPCALWAQYWYAYLALRRAS